MNNEPNYIGKEPCPRCVKMGRDNRGDNLAIYSDHAYCYACQYYEVRGTSLERIKKQFHTVESSEPKKITDIPYDASSEIRIDALQWVKSYGITSQEIADNRLCWSEKTELLIFPIIDNEAWQGRYFGKNKDHPKYLTRGIKNDVFHFLGKNEGRIVVVEDLISAIKCARVTSSMPVLGSNLNRDQLQIISRYYKDLDIWLDPNMYKQMLKIQMRAELFFNKVNVHFTDKDPKYYSTQEIKNELFN